VPPTAPPSMAAAMTNGYASGLGGMTPYSMGHNPMMMGKLAISLFLSKLFHFFYEKMFQI